MEILQAGTISCLRGLQCSCSSSEEGCQKQSSFPSPGIQQQSKQRQPFLPNTTPEEGARETQPELAIVRGSWGRATSPATHFSYFGSWSPPPTKHIPSYSLPVPTSLRAHERTGKTSHHKGENSCEGNSSQI